MHVDFADWYRPCTTGTETRLTEELLQKRWAGVEKLAEDSAKHALQLVRIALQKKSAPAEVVGALRSAFKEADATFQMSGNELEMSVLAGSIACQVMTVVSDEADLIALGMVCATAFLPNQLPWVTPFTVRAQSYLDERLQTVRKAEDIRRPQVSQKKLKPSVDAYVARIAENSPGPTSEAAKALVEALVQALISTTEVASEAIAELERQSRLRREETDILWWMNTGVSRDLGVSFKSLKTLAASVVAGKELASLVSPPGVLPALSLLQGMIPPLTGKGAANKSIGLIAAVKATDREWRQSVVDELDVDGIADLSPALTAIRQSLTTDEAGGWTSAYKKAEGFEADPQFQPADLGLQVHRECLLAVLASKE
jgi:hypothetical protein